MGPQTMMEAELLAKHIVDTKHKIGLSHGVRYPTWAFTQPKEKKVMIETAALILSVSTEKSKQDSMALVNPIQSKGL